MNFLFVDQELSLICLASHHQLIDFSVIYSKKRTLIFKNFFEEEISFKILKNLPYLVRARFHIERFEYHVIRSVRDICYGFEIIDLCFEVNNISLLIIERTVLYDI